MKRRILAVLLSIFFLMTSCAFTFKFDSLNKNIRVGLRNMTAASINVVLTGDYVLNDVVFNSGTSFNLLYKDGKITFEDQCFDELVFTPQSSQNLIRLEIGAKKYSYRGTMDFKVSGSSILPINTIDLETYLKGVVAYEMSNSYPMEALKAQAVAARNYALTDLGKHGGLGYDLCDTTDCQVYKGYNANYTNVIKAVDETKGKVLIYGDELVYAYYAASHGGYSEASGNIWSKQLPYLISKKDDMENENWPYGNQIFTTKDIDAKLKSKSYIKATDKFEKIDLDTIVKNASGRVASIDILYFNSSGIECRKSIIKEGPRTFLSLPSTLYDVVYDSTTDTYTFSGKGYGHGVGMSQIGAKNRANAGQTYDMILAFYYDGSKIVDINNNIKNDGTDISQTTGEGISINIPKNTSPDSSVPPKTTDSSVVVPPAKESGTDNISTLPSKTTNSSINIIPAPNEKPIVNSSKDATKNTNLSFPRILKLGMSGEDVKRFQDALKKLKYLQIKNTTNYFGATTEKSVKLFQKNQGLKSNGIADRLTLDMVSNLLMTDSVRDKNKITKGNQISLVNKNNQLIN